MPAFVALRYRDAPAAIAWLETLGFRATERIDNPDGTVAHGELRLGDALVMLGSGPEDLEGPPPDDARAARSSVYVGTPDVEEIHTRARAPGTEVSDLFDQAYGSRDFNAGDAEPLVLRDLRPQAAAARPDSA